MRLHAIRHEILIRVAIEAFDGVEIGQREVRRLARCPIRAGARLPRSRGQQAHHALGAAARECDVQAMEVGEIEIGAPELRIGAPAPASSAGRG